MKKWLPLLLCLLVPSAFAGLYKWVDTDGNIHYTDTPPPQGAEEVTLPPNVTYTPAEIPSDSPSSTQPAAKDDGKYQELVITKPKMNETVRNNTGEVPVEYALTPGLKPGHQFRVILDGTALENEFTQEQIVLQNLKRGSHTVQIHAVDAAGVPQISSQSVVFFLRQESKLDAGSEDSGTTTDNTKSLEPDYTPESAEDQSSEYEDTTAAPSSDEGITQHQDESDYGTTVTDPADSRDTVYDQNYDNTTTTPSSGDRFKSGTGYTPNYQQQ